MKITFFSLIFGWQSQCNFDQEESSALNGVQFTPKQSFFDHLVPFEVLEDARKNYSAFRLEGNYSLITKFSAMKSSKFC